MRAFIGSCCWIAIATLALALAPAPTDAAPRPSIVLVLADDMRLDDLQAMPQAQRLLGAGGASFSRAYVSASLCCPSRATLLTGRYPHNTGVRGNYGPDGGFPAFRTNGNEERTIATRLRAAGYRTALIGKYLNGYRLDQAEHVPPGWDTWAATDGGSHQQVDYRLNEDGRMVRYGSREADFATDVFTGKALEVIDRAVAADAPFFIYLSYLGPHEPAAAAPRHAALFRGLEVPRTPSFLDAEIGDRPSFFRLLPLRPEQIARLDGFYGQRLRSLASIDEAVRTIHDHLAASGRLAETYIVFTSDNGFKLGHHRLGIGKETAFADDSQVPLLMRGPGIAPGTRVDALTTSADLAPTWLDWAGLRAAPELDGRSLEPWLDGTGGAPPAWRTSVPVFYRPDPGVEPTAVASGALDGLPIVHPPEYRGLRGERLLFVDYTGGERELYDTAADPFELRNIAGTTDPAVIATLTKRAAAIARCAGATCRLLEDAPLPTLPSHWTQAAPSPMLR